MQRTILRSILKGKSPVYSRDIFWNERAGRIFMLRAITIPLWAAARWVHIGAKKTRAACSRFLFCLYTRGRGLERRSYKHWNRTNTFYGQNELRYQHPLRGRRFIKRWDMDIKTGSKNRMMRGCCGWRNFDREWFVELSAYKVEQNNRAAVWN